MPKKGREILEELRVRVIATGDDLSLDYFGKIEKTKSLVDQAEAELEQLRKEQVPCEDDIEMVLRDSYDVDEGRTCFEAMAQAVHSLLTEGGKR